MAEMYLRCLGGPQVPETCLLDAGGNFHNAQARRASFSQHLPNVQPVERVGDIMDIQYITTLLSVHLLSSTKHVGET